DGRPRLRGDDRDGDRVRAGDRRPARGAGRGRRGRGKATERMTLSPAAGADAAALEAALGPVAERDPRALAEAGADFGHLRDGTAVAVAAPRTLDELAQVIARAGAAGVRVTARGTGSSQGGQSVPRRGLS